MSYRNWIQTTAMCAALMCGAGAVEAAPVTLTYEGDLVASGGAPAQGEHKIEFSLYASSAGGAALWTEVHPDVLVVDGHFFVDLGRQTPLEDLTGDDALFLGVAIDDDAEAEPRMTVGGALRSQWAALAANAQDVREADIQPRSVALAGTPTRLENGSLRLGAEANQVLTAASLATLTGGGNADALHTHAGQVGSAPRYVGNTVATFTGNLGGPLGANQKCSSEYPDSHMCGFCEVLLSYRSQPLSEIAWTAAGSALDAVNDTPALYVGIECNDDRARTLRYDVARSCVPGPTVLPVGREHSWRPAARWASSRATYLTPSPAAPTNGLTPAAGPAGKRPWPPASFQSAAIRSKSGLSTQRQEPTEGRHVLSHPPVGYLRPEERAGVGLEST